LSFYLCFRLTICNNIIRMCKT